MERAAVIARARSGGTTRPPIRLRAALRRLSAVLLALSAVVSLAVGAQPQSREPLNSERIAQTFDSYGVEVLHADAGMRVSNLFSVEGGTPICRTFAVVLFSAKPDPAVAAEHARIVGGDSIGATFADKGWQISKTHLAFRQLPATARLAALMHVAVGTRLAEHAYVLDVAKAGRRVEYAALVEIHHPGYLVGNDLERIYGKAAPGSRTQLLDELLAAARRAAQ